MPRKKKLTRKEKEAIPLNEDFKIRVLNARKHLPKSGITSLFFHYFEDFEDSVKNRSRVSNVLQTRVTDEEITLKLERLVEILKPKNN